MQGGWFSIFEMNAINHYNRRHTSATDEIIFRSLYTVFKSNEGRKKEVVEASSVDLLGVSGCQARLYLYRWFARSVTVLNSLGIGRTSAGCKFAWCTLGIRRRFRCFDQGSPWVRHEPRPRSIYIWIRVGGRRKRSGVDDAHRTYRFEIVYLRE